MSTMTRPTITNKGRALADALHPYIGYTTAIVETCSLIMRHAVTHNRLAEMACSDADRYEWAEQRSEQIEARIASLVQDLPETDDGPWTVTFDGDPRGFTVKLHHPNHELHNTWGGPETGFGIG